jgi:hypothetical protein
MASTVCSSEVNLAGQRRELVSMSFVYRFVPVRTCLESNGLTQSFRLFLSSTSDIIAVVSGKFLLYFY